jgi:hypothetical protein
MDSVSLGYIEQALQHDRLQILTKFQDLMKICDSCHPFAKGCKLPKNIYEAGCDH